VNRESATAEDMRVSRMA